MSYYESGRDPSLPPIHESVRRKRRWGCACGCAVFLLLLVFGIVGATYWLLRTQPAISKDFVYPPGATGFGVVRLDGEDPGIKDLSKYTLELVKRNAQRDPSQGQAVVYALNTLQAFVAQLVSNEAVVALVPLSAESSTAASSPAPVFDVLFAFSTKNHFGTILGQLLLKGAHGNQSAISPHNGGIVVSAQSSTAAPVFVGWLRNLMIVSTKDTLLRDTIDRVAANKATPVDLDLQDLLDQIQFNSPPAGQDFAFGMLVKSGQLQSLIKRLLSHRRGSGPTPDQAIADMTTALTAAGLSWEDAQGFTMTGDVVNADSVRFEFRFVLPRPEAAKKLQTVLNQALEVPAETTPAANSSDLAWRREIKTIGSVVQLTLTVNNIKAFLQQTMFSGSNPTPNRSTATVTSATTASASTTP